MKNKNILLIISITFIILASYINLISAIKVPTNHDYGLQVNIWDVNAIKQNENYTFVWDVSDKYGKLLKANETNCTFVNFPNGKLGYLVGGVASKTSDNNAWYFLVNGTNLSMMGQYNYQIDCYLLSNSSISGNVLDSYLVVPIGAVLDTSYAIVLSLGFIFVLIISVMFFVLALKTEMMGLKLFFYSMCAMLIVLMIGYFITLGHNLLWQLPSFIGAFNSLFIIAISLLSVGAIGLILYLIYMTFTQFQKIRFGKLE